MPDHDELLPEEKAYPEVIQELRTAYRMKPEERLVLDRVHRRLADDTYALPFPESVRQEGSSPSQWSVFTVSPSVRPVNLRQRWLRPLNLLAAVLFVGVLVGALVFAFSGSRSSVGSPPVKRIHIFLVPAQQGYVPSQIEWKTTGAILSQRFGELGLGASSVRVATVNARHGILIDLPQSGADERQTINTLIETGALEFWSTGQGNQLVPGTLFRPDQYTRDNPGGHPLFTNADIDPNKIMSSQDRSGIPDEFGILLRMKGASIQHFQKFTATHVGQMLTVTLDRKVLASAGINSAISGSFILPTSLMQQQASAIIAVLQFGPLPVALKQQS